MLTLIIILALLQQHQLNSGWALGVTLGEAIGSVAILSISLKKGIGGILRSDLVCYGLLALSLCVWFTTDDPLLALHLSIATDLIAFAPTLLKSWRLPSSETPLFYIGGIASALLSCAAASSYSYAIVVFPLYLALVNTVQLAVMYRPGRPDVESDATLVS
jgi:hypothetical protein